MDRIVAGRCCGGIRATAGVTSEELRRIAAVMTLKCGFVGLAVGGAKGGIVMPSGGPGTDVVPVAVAHLRCTAAAAIQLRDAIDKALLIGAPVQNPEGKAN